MKNFGTMVKDDEVPRHIKKSDLLAQIRREKELEASRAQMLKNVKKAVSMNMRKDMSEEFSQFRNDRLMTPGLLKARAT